MKLKTTYISQDLKISKFDEVISTGIKTQFQFKICTQK